MEFDQRWCLTLELVENTSDYCMLYHTQRPFQIESWLAWKPASSVNLDNTTMEDFMRVYSRIILPAL